METKPWRNEVICSLLFSHQVVGLVGFAGERWVCLMLSALFGTEDPLSTRKQGFTADPRGIL